MNSSRGLNLLCVMAVVYLASGILAQSRADNSLPKPPTMSNDLMNSFQAESKRGTNLSYTQSYSLHRKHVEFHGSIFGVIQEVRIDGCELKIKSMLSDLYSGNIGPKLVGQTQNRYLTSIDFKLTPLIAARLQVVDVRPVRQLAQNTSTVCLGDRQCTLTWIKLKADAPVIRMTEITNDWAGYDGDVKDFDGPVAQFLLPVSSASAGYELIGKMRDYAKSCAN